MLRCQCPSVCPVCLWSVTEVHWRIIANLVFKYRSKFTAPARTRSACGRALRLTVHAGALLSLCMTERGEGSSSAMLATARPLVAGCKAVLGLVRALQTGNSVISWCNVASSRLAAAASVTAAASLLQPARVANTSRRRDEQVT